MKFKSGQGGEPQTVHTLRQGEATLYWFLLIHYSRLPDASVIKTGYLKKFQVACCIAAWLNSTAKAVQPD